MTEAILINALNKVLSFKAYLIKPEGQTVGIFGTLERTGGQTTRHFDSGAYTLYIWGQTLEEVLSARDEAVKALNELPDNTPEISRVFVNSSHRADDERFKRYRIYFETYIKI